MGKCDGADMEHKVFHIPERAGVYFGRCAGGAGRGFGGQYLIIAANNDVLAKLWEALEGVKLNEGLTYGVGVIDDKKLRSMLDAVNAEGDRKPCPECGGKLMVPVTGDRMIGLRPCSRCPQPLTQNAAEDSPMKRLSP